MKSYPKKTIWIIFGLVFTLTAVYSLWAQDRFPKPEFETEYIQPLTTTPQPKSPFKDIVDITVLIVTLSIASFLALKKRSRQGIFNLMLFSVIYFGFIRQGCVCSVGSLQNIALALADTGYILPLVAVAFFVIPLAFTLFFGRTFCAAVCPLGAVQDLVTVKPVKVPTWLSQVLSIIPYIYLGLAVLFAATGAAFIVCQYDPFVSLFRFSGEFGILIYSGVFIILSLFICRPYCRFLCPYGVLLSWMSFLSKKHLSITPDDCIDCKLCEDVCPVDAIKKPTPEKVPETRKQGIKRLFLLIILLPVAVFLGGWAISKTDTLLSRVHPRVRLAERIYLEESGYFSGGTDESKAFRSSGTTIPQLYQETVVLRNRFRRGGWFLGAFLGLSIMLKLIGLSIRRQREDYEPDKSACVSCGRCFKSCPQEHERLKLLKKNKG